MNVCRKCGEQFEFNPNVNPIGQNWCAECDALLGAAFIKALASVVK